jgi:hypothetical protein
MEAGTILPPSQANTARSLAVLNGGLRYDDPDADDDLRSAGDQRGAVAAGVREEG